MLKFCANVLGSVTSVKLEYLVQQKKLTNWRECSSEESQKTVEAYNNPTNTSISYQWNVKACQSLSIQKEIIKDCDCLSPLFLRPLNISSKVPDCFNIPNNNTVIMGELLLYFLRYFSPTIPRYNLSDNANFTYFRIKQRTLCHEKKVKKYILKSSNNFFTNCQRLQVCSSESWTTHNSYEKWMLESSQRQVFYDKFVHNRLLLNATSLRLSNKIKTLYSGELKGINSQLNPDKFVKLIVSPKVSLLMFGCFVQAFKFLSATDLEAGSCNSLL